MSVQQYTEIAGIVPSTASDVYRSCTASRTEDREATDFCAGSLDLVQSYHPYSGGHWSEPRKQTRVTRTLREKTSVTEAFLGTIRTTSTTTLQTARQTGDLTSHYEQDQQVHKISYTIYPSPWLIRLGIHYGLRLGFLSSSTQGWKNTLNTFCPVPDDALIFEFCRQGNVPAVRDLLSRGHASVRDTDSWGATPLHVSLVGEVNLELYLSMCEIGNCLMLALSMPQRIIIQSFV